MHGLRAGLAGSLDDFLHRQIALSSGRRSDRNSLISHFDVQRIAVSLGINGDRLDPHPPGSFDNPAGDLAAVCDQNSFEHVLALQPLKRDPARELAAIWHAAVDVTIPSYSKTKQRQRLVIGKMSFLGSVGFIAPYVGRSVRVQP